MENCRCRTVMSPGFLYTLPHRTQDEAKSNGFLKVTKPPEVGDELSSGIRDSFLHGPKLLNRGFQPRLSAPGGP